MDKFATSYYSVKAERLNQLSREVIGAAIAVHKALGPGLLESAYEACLYYELTERGMKVAQQVPLPDVVPEIVRLPFGPIGKFQRYSSKEWHRAHRESIPRR